MDGKYLSVPEVVHLSESFVCARLLSYESAEEAEFLTSIFRGRSGELENTVFCILDSDGETTLTRAGRSPDFLLPRREAEVDDLVQAMERVLARPSKVKAKANSKARALPVAVDLRRAVNTAACDGLPVVVLRADADDAAFVADVWKHGLAGEAVYVRVDRAEWKRIDGAGERSAVLVLFPDAFGLQGTLSAQRPKLDASSAKWLAQQITDYAAPSKTSSEHVRAGRRAGINWETEIPVTDSQVPERRARH